MVAITCEQCIKSRAGVTHNLYCKSTRLFVRWDQVNQLSHERHGFVKGVRYCKYGAKIPKKRKIKPEDEKEPVVCHSEYSTIIKRCRFGEWKDGILWCKCPRDCAECVIGSGDNGIVPMKPELYYKRKESRGMIINNSQRGLAKVLKDRQEERDGKDKN